MKDQLQSDYILDLERQLAEARSEESPFGQALAEVLPLVILRVKVARARRIGVKRRKS